MARRRVIDDALYAHFITFSVEKRRKLLQRDESNRILLDVLNQQLVSFSARCIAFVLMPDHVHAVIWFSATGQLSRFMHGWKRISSFRIREWYRENAAGYFSGFGLGERFWQPKYYSFEINERAMLEEKVNYIHENPVRAGLTERATDWTWSSARWYENQEPVGVPIEWVE